MKKVLFISYYFPPLGLGGVQRSLKFARYLPEFGWKPYILTVKEISYYAKDPSLLKEISNERIYRTGSLDPLRLHWKVRSHRSYGKEVEKAQSKGITVLHKIINLISFPDDKVFWFPFALFKAIQICRNEII